MAMPKAQSNNKQSHLLRPTVTTLNLSPHDI